MIISDIRNVLEVFPVVLKIEKETFLLVIVHHIPGRLGTSTDVFILLFSELPTQHRILIFDGFNLDQMLPENAAKVDPLIQNFNLCQCSQYPTHIRAYSRKIIWAVVAGQLIFPD